MIHMTPDHEAVFLILRRALASSFLNQSVDSLKTNKPAGEKHTDEVVTHEKR